MDLSSESSSELPGSEQASPATPREELPAALYLEFRKVAHRFMRNEGSGHTLQPTALVHEAFLRMTGREAMVATSPTHVRALYAQAMRRILVDHARRKNARKRGGERVRVALDENLLSVTSEQDVLDLEEVLEKLAQLDPVQEKLVELRIFGGMTVAEAAAEMGVSKRTAEREWTATRAWLRRELAAAETYDS